MVDALRREGALRLHYEALRVVGECSGHTAAVVACAWAPDGSALVTASCDSTARVWRAGDWSCVHILNGHTEELGACAWAPDGSALLTASSDGTARVWRAGDWSCGRTLNCLAEEKDEEEVNEVTCAWAPDGSALVTTSDDGTVRVWSDV